MLWNVLFACHCFGLPYPLTVIVTPGEALSIKIIYPQIAVLVLIFTPLMMG